MFFSTKSTVITITDDHRSKTNSGPHRCQVYSMHQKFDQQTIALPFI